MIGKENTTKIDFIIDNKMTTDSKLIANTFNNYFINVGGSLAEKN